MYNTAEAACEGGLHDAIKSETAGCPIWLRIAKIDRRRNIPVGFTAGLANHSPTKKANARIVAREKQAWIVAGRLFITL